ncbi:HalOD1 output domain-containing protein [Natrarchaeobius sp. A-rgal3]|uniref:HalOD1 output domain-containing protein n=1 Tax=Natrarchaeobius versutus TaxID=1679078 RepID=UPI00350EE55D
MHPAISTVLTRVAARDECDRTALPPLYEVVDPGALTAILESGANVTVRFAYAGYLIVIDTDPLEVEMIDEER